MAETRGRQPAVSAPKAPPQGQPRYYSRGRSSSSSRHPVHRTVITGKGPHTPSSHARPKSAHRPVSTLHKSSGGPVERPRVASPHAPVGSIKMPVASVSPVNAHGSSLHRPATSSPPRSPRGTAKEYFDDPSHRTHTVVTSSVAAPPGLAHPAGRSSAWYPVEPERVTLGPRDHHMSVASSGGGGGSPVKKVYRSEALDEERDAPPEFLAQQWGGLPGQSGFGWWQGSQLQSEVITGTLVVESMDLSLIPTEKLRVFEEKAVVDISRMFSHPPWHCQVAIGPESLLLRYRLELPDPGPNSCAVLARAATEYGKRAVRLPEVEREYRITTGLDVPGIINYEASTAPTVAKRARASSPKKTEERTFQSANAPLHIKAIEGQRRMEVVGPHKSFEGSTEWTELPARPPPLPDSAAAGRVETSLPRALHDDSIHGSLGRGGGGGGGLLALQEGPHSHHHHHPSHQAVTTTVHHSTPRGTVMQTTTSNGPVVDSRPPPFPGLVAASVPLRTVGGSPLPSLEGLHGGGSGGGELQLRTTSPPPPLSRDLALLDVPPAAAVQAPPPVPPAPVPEGRELQTRAPSGRELQAIRQNLKPYLREQEAKFADAGRKGQAAVQMQLLGELGRVYQEHGDHEGSVLYLSRQLEMLQNTDAPDRMRDMSKVCSMLGTAYWSLSKWDKALTYHQKRLDIAELQKDRRGMGAAYGNLGNVYHAMGDYRAAVQYHLRHQGCVSAEDMETMSAVYHNLGLAQHGAKDYDASLDSFRHALEITVSLGNQKQAARIHGNLAMAYKAKGKLQEAVNELHLQLKTELRIQDLAGGASTSLSLGNAYVSQGDYKNAAMYYDRGVDLCDWHHHAGSTRPRPRLHAKLLIASGSCRYHTGDFSGALTNLEKALKIATDSDDTELRAASHCNLGLCLNMLKKHSKALQHHKRHLDLSVSTGDRTAEGTAHGNIGNTYKMMGEHNSALDHYELDLDIARETGDKLAQGQAYDNLGLCCHELGEFPLAVEYHTKALRIMKGLGYRAGEAEAHAHLGTAFDNLGHTKQAIQHHHAHLEAAKELNDTEGQGRAYGALGKSCFDFGMYQKAGEYQQKRLRVARQLKDSVAEARACGHLFLVLSALGSASEAEEYLVRHRELCAKHDLQTIEDTVDGVCHIKMEIASAMQDPATKEAATQRLVMLANSLG